MSAIMIVSSCRGTNDLLVDIARKGYILKFVYQSRQLSVNWCELRVASSIDWTSITVTESRGRVKWKVSILNSSLLWDDENVRATSFF